MNVILTHEHADFDAVASLVGMARLLPHAVPVLPQAVNDNVAEYLTVLGGRLPLRHRDELPRERVEHAFFVDTRRAQAVRGMTSTTPTSIIDHHLDSEPPAANVLELDVQPVGATATLIAERLASAARALPDVEATLLLLGIYEDTGSFTFGATTARDLRAAAWLITGGADLKMRDRFLRYSLSGPAQELYRSLLDAAETVDSGGHTIVVTAVRSPGFADELATLATKMIDYLDPTAVLMLVDVGGHVQLVARSVSDGVDVGVIAEAVGGGGHKRAAAAVMRDVDLSEAKRSVLAALPAAVRSRALVADVMSRGDVRTLAPEQTVEEGLAIARRHGHEGYPVVEAGHVLGIVTRRDLDRALHHHLGHRTIRSLLGREVPTVTPGDSAAVLLKAMTEHDVGQIPVVEGGRLVGIATRTDLLRQWSERAREGDRAGSAVSVREKLTQALGEAPLRAVLRLADVAQARGERAYLVGGLPRDLVLGVRPSQDIDVVIEGDALAVARATAEAHGGRVTAHSRFGTAKWIRDDVAIDLISARTEYYREPTALPSVSRGSLRSDLRRRDFTINTLAVDLAPESYGRIIDLYGGLSDLDLRVVRVLHSLSFIEDPTRIIRAFRFAVRLGFEIEGRTAELIPEAAVLLRRVSGARIRNELLQLFAEPAPTDALDQLDGVGALEAIEPGLRRGDRTEQLLRELPDAWSRWRGMAAGAELAAQTRPVHGLAVWLASLGKPGVHAADRLRMTRRDTALVSSVVALVDAPGELADPDVPGSTLHRALRALPPEALVLTSVVAEDAGLLSNLIRYGAVLADVRTAVAGDDLARMGLAPGPPYGRVLHALLDARLDGHVNNRDDEMALAQRLVAEELENGAP